MLKITEGTYRSNGRVLTLDGRIAGPWVVELQAQCERILAQGLALTLDLSGVSYLERNGAALVSGMKNHGVTVIGCSPFVSGQIQGEPAGGHPASICSRENRG